MSVQNAPQAKLPVEDDLAEIVENYLKEHPGFFSQRQRLLGELQVTHACGEASSLIEHQVNALRAQNHQLRRRLRELLSNARDNQELSGKLHRLTLELVDCNGLDQILSLLYASLQDDLAAQRVSIRLFESPQDPRDTRLAEFVPATETSEQLLEELQRSGGPLCGRLRSGVAGLLFDDEYDAGSGIIMLLGELRPFGVLAVANRDPKHYQPGMGTLFMQQLAEIAQQLIRRHLR